MLVVADEIANYLLTVPLYIRTSRETGGAILCTHGPKSYLIFDEDQVSYQVSCNTFIKKLALINKHKSIQSCSIKNRKIDKNYKWIDYKQVNGTGEMGRHYFQTCTYVYNRFTSPALNGLSPFELAFGRPSKPLLEIETRLKMGQIDHLKNIMSS